ncbi:MAG: tRNA pseudouridine(38-40) synthase TruA [bacterium]|jgi:tRNA pseudouridine38-40 synthase|nr:tRNA pseudouridine(38-40) synthase TruA [bacterium]
MRNIRLDVEYDGRNYCGWQWQKDLVTLEGTIKAAVERMVGHEIILYSSGRTDAGVHAEQHVAHFFTESTLSVEKFWNGLNALTPWDIAIKRVVAMPLDWRARQDAIEREYRYTFYNAPVPHVFLQPYTCWVRSPLDLEAMRGAAAYFVGKHDFSAFRSQHCDADNPVRTMLECAVIEDRPLIHLRVRGHAFLRHQVRIMAGALRQIGLGWKTPEHVQQQLAGKERDSTDETLFAGGLTLVAVRYAGEEPGPADSQVLTRLYYARRGNQVE